MVISGVNTVTYNGNGSQTAWPFTFPIASASEIKVQLINADGTTTAVTSDYYVDVVNNTVYYPGYAPGAEPPEADQPPKVQTGQKIEIYREVPMTQEANLGDVWPYFIIEKGLDKLTMICQQIYSYTNRKLDSALASMFQLAGIVTDSGKLQHITDQYNAIDANAAAAADSADDAEASAAMAKKWANYTGGVVADSEYSAKKYATDAGTSATNAANSDASATATAAALTAYLDTKETLTAPAVDATLTISGAAADAKVVGDNLGSIYAEYATATLAVYDSVSSRALSDAGAVAYDANSKVMTYAVTAGEKVKLNLATRESESYKVTWEFTTVGTISSLGSGSVVAGTIHTGAINDVVIVPTGATYLAIAQRIDNTTNTVQKKVLTDKTLSISGEAADAKVVGDNLDSIEDNFDSIYAQYNQEYITKASTTDSRALSNAGALAYDATSRVVGYNVSPKEILHLKIASRDTESYKVTWVFKDSNGVVVGSVHTGAIDDEVIVSAGASVLYVAELLTNTTNSVKRTKLPNEETQVELLSKGSYESLKGGFDYGHIKADTGQPDTPNLKFAHSASLVSYDRDVVIYVKPIYRWWLHRYQSDGTWIGLTGGPFTYQTPLLIPQGIYFKLTFTTTTNIDIDIDDLKEDILVTAPLFSTYHISNANIKQIAHQGLRNAGYSTGGNLAYSYRKAGLVGFTYGETDVAFTSDGVPVCIHDSSFVDETSLETVVIANTTYEDLLTHNYRQGNPVSSFDDVVKACKESGLGLYIDHLSIDFTDAQWQSLFSIVKKYTMQDKVVWTTTGTQIPNKIKTYYPNANFAVVVNTENELAGRLAVANAIKNDNNEVELSLLYTAFTVASLPALIDQLPPTITVSVWAVDDITTYKSYIPYVSGITSNAICVNLARVNE